MAKPPNNTYRSRFNDNNNFYANSLRTKNKVSLIRTAIRRINYVRKCWINAIRTLYTDKVVTQIWNVINSDFNLGIFLLLLSWYFV